MNKNISKIAKNAISLGLVKGIDMGTQLLTMPFIISVIGIDNFGIISFYLVIIQYLNMLCDFGFNFTATRNISIHRGNKEIIDKIFSSVMFLKLGIAFFFVIVLLLLCLLGNGDKMYLFLIMNVVGFGLFPSWLFQGIEKMSYITYAKVFSRALYVLLIYLFIREKEFYENIILFEGISSFLMGIIGFIMAFFVADVKFIRLSLKDIIDSLREASYLFFSSLFITLYRNSNVFILGLGGLDACVGFYAAAEKVVRAIQSMIEPIISALYPFLSKQFSCSSLRDNIKLICRISIICSLVLLPLILIVYCYSEEILLFFAIVDAEAIRDLKIMSFAILFGSLNYILGIVGVANLGFNRYFLCCVVVSGILSVLFSISFVPMYKDLASAISLIIGEGFLFVMLLAFLVEKFFCSKSIC